MMHVDKNSLKHSSICFALSLEGEHGACIALGASITKEYDDSKQKENHWCWSDLAFDALGIIAGLTVHWLVFKSLSF